MNNFLKTLKWSKKTIRFESIFVDTRKALPKEWSTLSIVYRNRVGLVMLLCGYYSDYQGTIQYDDTDLKQLGYDEIMSLSAIIHQDIYIFNESVRDNICLHQEYADNELERVLAII